MTTYDTRHSDLVEPVTEPTVLLADDGRELRATWFRPGLPARGAVLVVPAMATPAAYYSALATWLVESGYLTLTFDYRGTGSPAEMRAERGDLLRWAGDAASALEHLLDYSGDLPVTWLGHSLGGQILPFARHDLLDRVLLVASGSGYWRLNVPSLRWRAPLLWRAIAPAAIRATGYYPGSRIGLLGDLPPNVMRQWGRWCLDPSYLGADVRDAADRFREVTVPITTLSFTDDELLSGASMRALEEWYVAAPVEARRFAPADLGVERVGHHGFFRAAHRPAWDQLVLPALASRQFGSEGGAPVVNNVAR
jgi:predicted alpha/beta hydrolase